jgi:hypothetical protein
MPEFPRHGMPLFFGSLPAATAKKMVVRSMNNKLKFPTYKSELNEWNSAENFLARSRSTFADTTTLCLARSRNQQIIGKIYS